MAVSSPITVVIVDDHEIVRRGLVDLLTLDDAFEVVGEAATGAEALQVVRATRPRVVLLDVRLPDRSGVSVCRTLGRGPQPPAVLMLTSFSDADAAAASAEAFARSPAGQQHAVAQMRADLEREHAQGAAMERERAQTEERLRVQESFTEQWERLHRRQASATTAMVDVANGAIGAMDAHNARAGE